MHRRSRLLVAAFALALAALAPAATAHADTPTPGALYHDGQTGRYLMGGTWQFRQGTGAWRDVTVPYAWNIGSDLVSYLGGVATYKKDFELPSASSSASWVVRFESINDRASISLNGHHLGSHLGASVPFELVLPARYLHRTGANELLVTTDSRSHTLDFPFQGVNADGNPVAGWWPYAGILREVYLRQVDRIDLTDVQVLPILNAPHSTVPVDFRARATNLSSRTQHTRVSATFGSQRVSLGSATLAPGASRELTGRLRVRNARLWEPGSPTLYDASVDAAIGRSRVARFDVRTGIRSLRVAANGTFLLNGRPLSARGFAIHDDSLEKGAALDNAQRNQILDWAQEGGATMLRAHYPLHPEMLEQADARGLVVWSEIPFYQVKTANIGRSTVMTRAERMLRAEVLADSNHPSIIVWSIANELNSRPNAVQGNYIRRQVRTAKELDPTRPVGLAFAGYPSSGCQSWYKPLDVLGVNLYFGWYTGSLGEIADREGLSAYLDSLHRCYGRKAIFATEFGAEANRDGPADEKGTYAFQAQWAHDIISVFDTKPWLSGAIYWTLQEFRIRPNWDGSNPWPTAPLHQKGLITLDGVKKPAFDVVAGMYKAHQQLGPLG
jgi:beta-glucuronidase